LDFGNPGAADIINAWVSSETKGKIQGIVDPPIHPTTIMFLINAIYFKGDWTHRFPKDKTTQANFSGLNGASGPVPLMELRDTLPYAETDSYQAVDLPYGGRAFSMTVLLPKANHSVQELVADLSPGMWNQVVAGLTRKEGTVYLPRFRLEWGRELNDDLQAMGMVVPFGGGADFSGLSDEALQRGLYISKVKQKTYVDVNEEGTEAAGVTSVELREFANPDHFLFRADRPFLFVIRERFSQTILFAGVMVEPPEA
jgi:serpin B